MTLYDTEALTKLAVATFTRSKDLAIHQYYKTLAAYNSGLLGGAPGPLMKLLNLRDELEKEDLEPDFAAKHDALLPSEIELSIIFRKMAGVVTELLGWEEADASAVGDWADPAASSGQRAARSTASTRKLHYTPHTDCGPQLRAEAAAVRVRGA